MTMITSDNNALGRRQFLSNAGKGLGLMAVSSAAVASLCENVNVAGRNISHLSPIKAAMTED